MKFFIKILKKKFPYLLNLYVTYINRERRVSYGKLYPDNFFYIIGQDDDIGGLWWLVNKTLMHIGYCIEKGYIPIVDLQNNHTQYTKEYTFGKENVWEMFFEQPMGYGLDDIKEACNVIINKKAAYPSKSFFMGQFYDDKKKIEFYRELFRKYIRFNSMTLEELELSKNKILPKGAKVVGVLCRGTDYVLNQPKNHPIQPDSKMVIQDVKKVMRNYGCDYVFLATEDQDIYDDFKTAFDNHLLAIEQKRISKKNMASLWLSDEKKKNNDDPYLSGLNYLTATYILSKCDCFISGRTGGAKGVLLMTDGFIYKYIYDLGLYP